MQNSTVYMADFETTTKPTLDLEGHTRVWAWGFTDIFKAHSPWDVLMGNDLESFVQKMRNTGGLVFFHNLKFDGAFIIDWLLNHGYTHTTTDYPRTGEFCTLISRMGQFYRICVKWDNGTFTDFRDSLKKLPMSVAEVAGAFKLKETKGEIDYDEYRPVGHELTQEERSYLANDVLIMASALRVQLEAGLDHMTVGSDALSEYKKLTGGPKMFNHMFPVLPEETDAEIRKSYRGGWTYVAKRFRQKKVKNGRVYDVNSLYPSVMYDELLPYGEPVRFEGKPPPNERYPLYTVTLTFTAKLKRGHVPCIQIKGSLHFSAVEYQSEIAEPVTLTCTNVDLALWQDHYHMDILYYEGGYMFKGVRGLFKDYIEKWMAIKANSTGGMRQLAKLQLNSLYGKFATNPDVTAKIPVLDPDTGAVKLVLGNEESREPVYTAMGSFITAYARDKTIRAAQSNYAVFAYADTDSLHLLCNDDPENLAIHPSELGKWKLEYVFNQAYFDGPKRYVEHIIAKPDKDGVLQPVDSWETHVAGLPRKLAASLRPKDFTAHTEIHGKLTPVRVPGGVVLVDTPFKL